jgi:membrane protease YdiL (CAAX protease family)
MDQLRHPNSGAGPCSLAELAPLSLPATSVRPSWLLAVETAVVGLGVLVAVRLLHVHAADLQWFLIPCVLVAGALAPPWVAGRGFPRIGLHGEHVRTAVKTALAACLCVLPPVYLGLWALTTRGLPIPLRPVLAEQQNWLSWLLYQFLYVAVAEEVFFRGYIQANVTRLLGGASYGGPRAGRAVLDPTSGSLRTAQYAGTIVISAGCFALAHVVVQGQILSALTFLPGLLMAWLFVRTRSLLAPILFHGLANVSYGILAMTFA